MDGDDDGWVTCDSEESGCQTFDSSADEATSPEEKEAQDSSDAEKS